jgi:type I restriction enzyme S subunit
LGKLAIIPPELTECNFNQAAVMIRPYLYTEIINMYLFYYLSEMSEINSISTKGSAGQVNISLTQSQNMRIPLPPLEEQKIVIKEIKKRFNILDIIESNENDIKNLTIQLKSKILELAIHGKLVFQDESDEPAIELLRRISPRLYAFRYIPL